MEKRNLSLRKKIYDICFFIYHSLKIDVQFIHAEGELSLKLCYLEPPAVLKNARLHTNSHIYQFFKENKKEEYVYYTDSFQLNYIGVGLWDQKEYQGAFILGPFLSSVPNDIFIYDIIKRHELSLNHQFEIRQYYTTIPIFNANLSHKIGYMVMNMAMTEFKETKVVYYQEKNVEYIDSEELWEDEGMCSEVEARFFIEDKIIEEVRRGNAKGALEVLGTFYFDASHRMPDNLLRVNKDLAFTYNTMLRIAARQGGVHPVYLHRSSDKFAILIEKANSIKELEMLHKKMTIEYCNLVKEVSTNGYSVLVKQAVDYINLHFEKELSLKKIAETINVNPSHLSKKFKRETGISITEFTNRKRMKEAKILLEKSNHSITDIAILVGFDDPGYFTSVFRKFVGMTPREYMKAYQKKEISKDNKK